MAIQIKEEDIPIIKILIDLNKCKLPMVCDYKCFEKCPQGVFHVWAYPYVSGKFMKPNHGSPKHYGISPGATPRCITCMECTENCPQQAITIEIDLPKRNQNQHPYLHPFESIDVGISNQEQIDENDTHFRKLIKK
ncbi:MAG: ferredoxin family protein [Candidatus Thorarchaeota archaeon]